MMNKSPTCRADLHSHAKQGRRLPPHKHVILVITCRGRKPWMDAQGCVDSQITSLCNTCPSGPLKPRAVMATAMLSLRIVRLAKSLALRPMVMARVPRRPCWRQSIPRLASPRQRLRHSSNTCAHSTTEQHS